MPPIARGQTWLSQSMPVSTVLNTGRSLFDSSDQGLDKEDNNDAHGTHVNDIAIGEVAKVKYLGHVITNDMIDDADMMRQRRQLYALGNVLSRRFHMCSIEVKNTLFRTFCTPMYTCQLWWNFSVQSMHKLNVAYNNAFRFMHHLPTYCSASLMFVVNRVPNCRAVIRNRIYGFMKRLVSSSNALVLSTVTSDARFRSRIVRHWLKSLYILMLVEIACMQSIQ